MVFLDGHSLVALAGTGSFSSTNIPCDSCLRKEHRHGSIPSSHQMLGAAILPPDVRAVIPLRPEPMVTPDGTEKHAGARHAAQRCITKLRHDHPPLTCSITADALRAHAPPLETLHDDGCHSMLGVKAGEQAYVFQQGQAAAEAGRVT